MNVKHLKHMLAAITVAALLPLSASAADVVVSIGWQAPPPLIVVSPGIQVVQEYDEEVFFIDGYYWVERDGRWYHSRDHHGKWIFVERSHVSGWLISSDRPRCRYKHWNKSKHDAHHAKSSNKSSNGAKSSKGGKSSSGGKNKGGKGNGGGGGKGGGKH